MKQFKLSLLFVLASFTISQAQYFDIQPGKFQFSTGLGLVSTFTAEKSTTLIPPVSARLDYFLSENFALGLYVAYTEVEGETTYQNAGIKESFHTSMYIYGLRATAYSNDLNGWHVYGGFLTGFSNPQVEKTTTLLDPDQTRDDNLPSFSRPAKNGFIFSGYIGTQKAFPIAFLSLVKLVLALAY